MTMSMSTEEASKKACPFMTRRTAEASDIGSDIVRCFGADCMKWEWFDGVEGELPVLTRISLPHGESPEGVGWVKDREDDEETLWSGHGAARPRRGYCSIEKA